MTQKYAALEITASLARASYSPAPVVVDGKAILPPRQIAQADRDAVLKLVGEEAKRDKNLFPLTPEMLSRWIEKRQGVVTEVEVDQNRQIIAFMGADSDQGSFVELRAAVVDPAFRGIKGLNINERNRMMLLHILFASEPVVLIRSVRNGAQGVEGIDDYYESMRSMGFKRVWETHDGTDIQFRKRVETVLDSLPEEKRGLAREELQERMQKAREAEARRVIDTQDEIIRLTELISKTDAPEQETDKLKEKLKKLSEAAVPHAMMTLLIRPWFDRQSALLRS